MANRIGFSGVPTGSQFEITAGDRARGTGAGGWGVAQAQGAPRATIRLKRSFLQVAPEGMYFSVDLTGFDTPDTLANAGTYQPSFHEIYYVWDFGDPGKTFTKPANILDEHRDANKAYGPIASHTYTAPGTYTVTLNVIEPASGKTAQTTLDVTVNDPEGLFAGDKTIFVDPDGQYGDAPAGARTTTTVLDALAMHSFEPGVHRIMLSRDKTHEMIGNVNQIRPVYSNLYFCASPVGTNLPIFRCWNTFQEARSVFWDYSKRQAADDRKTDIVFTDLEIRGLYDPVTEETEPYGGVSDFGPYSFLYQTPERASYVLFNNVTAGGFGTFWADLSNGYVPEDDPTDYVNIINDSWIDGWWNFGIYMDNPANFAATGTMIQQKLNASAGGLKGLSPDGLVTNNWHGPVRLQSCRDTVFDACDLFSNTGWFENSAGFHTVQPALRFAQTNSSDARLNLQRSHLESPGETINLHHQDGNSDNYPINMLLDKNYIVGGWCQSEVVQIRHGGATFRNNVIISPAVNRDGLYGAGVFGTVASIRLLSTAEAAPGTEKAPQKFYSNTFVTVGDSTVMGGTPVPVLETSGTGPAFEDVTIENNVDYFPNLPTGAAHAIDTTTLFPARYDGYRAFKHIMEGTLAADVAQGQSFTIPYGNFGRGVTGAGDFDFSMPDDPDSKRNRLLVQGIPLKPDTQGVYGMDESRFTFSTDATGVVITNNGPDTWLAGSNYDAACVRTTRIHYTEHATPADAIINASPTPGSTAIGGYVSGLIAYDDMRGNPRPALPALGAYELE